MPAEKEIIGIMDRLLPQGRLNRCHECDCEIIDLGGRSFLYTMDEFSEEDRLFERDPRLLGWNIAAGALSDIYACGGTPLYYAHSLTAAMDWDSGFIKGFAVGVADALKESKALFIGGDCGRSKAWRCCVSVIGDCGDAPLRRIGARPGDGIYLSGKIGAGNIQAALCLIPQDKFRFPGLSAIRFPIRGREAQIIRRHASCCIDTSDGGWKAVSIIADLNGCGYAINGLPYHRAGLLLAKTVSLPPILLFLAECGEYELLFTVPADREAEFTKESRGSGMRFFRVGAITENDRTASDGGTTIDLSSLKIEARNFDSAQGYFKALTAWMQLQKNKGRCGSQNHGA